jgi:hypothetical protein
VLGLELVQMGQRLDERDLHQVVGVQGAPAPARQPAVRPAPQPRQEAASSAPRGVVALTRAVEQHGGGLGAAHDRYREGQV